MAITQEVVALNVFPGGSTLDRRTRETSTGTSDRYTMTIASEPILHDFDHLKLGAEPAKAIKELIQRQWRAIGEKVSAETVLKRKSAARAYAAGKTWALARYSGGRTGAKPPGTGDQLFTDSGRLVDGLEVRENKAEGNWTINVPANRLDPRTFRDGEAGVSRMVQRLVALVPALRGGAEVLKDDGVVAAIKSATADAIFVAGSRAKAENRKAWASLRDQVGGQLLQWSGLL